MTGADPTGGGRALVVTPVAIVAFIPPLERIRAVTVAVTGGWPRYVIESKTPWAGN
jgi:hypothetical protein